MFSKQQYELLLLHKGFQVQMLKVQLHLYIISSVVRHILRIVLIFFFQNSGPTYIMVLSREDAVQGWRQVIGPTDPEKAKEENPDSCVFLNYLFSLKVDLPLNKKIRPVTIIFKFKYAWCLILKKNK